MTTFRVSSGLPAADHRRRMGDAVWLFLWYLDRQTGGHGWVLKSRRAARGRPLTDDEAARDLGVHVKTIGAQRRSLAAEGYIVTARARVGHRVQVTNQKKFPGVARSQDDARSDGNPSDPRGNPDATSQDWSRGNVNATSQREGKRSLSGSRCSESTPMMEGPRYIISSLKQEVQEVIYKGREPEAARSLFEEHARQFADTFGGSGPTPSQDDLDLVDALLELQDDPVDLLRRFWDQVRQVRGTKQAKFWRPTIRTFVGRVPDVLMLPAQPRAPLRAVNLYVIEHRGAFDMGADTRDDPQAVNPYQGVLATAWAMGRRGDEP